MIIPPKTSTGILLLLSGPTGSGKTTLCDSLAATYPKIERVVTCTTRDPRDGEKDGVDYHFLSDEEFDDAMKAEEFLEWAQVHASRYGTKKSAVFTKLTRGVDLIVNVDVQGARTYREVFGKHSTMRGRLVTVFVVPESMETIYDRILTRGTETPEQVDRRLKSAAHEVGQWKDYDYCIVSGTREDDFKCLDSIWTAEKRRVHRLYEAMKTAESGV